MAFWNRRRRQKITSPDGLSVVTLPGDYLSAVNLYGLRGSYGQIYRSQPNVRSVVDFLAAEVASVNAKLYEKVPAGPFLPSGRLELKDHKMQRLLDEPGPRVTRSRHWFATVADICVYDVAYWQKIRIQGQVRALVRIPPPNLLPERDPTTQRVVRYYTTMNRIRVELDDLVVFSGYDPEANDGNVSPLETLRRTLAEEEAAGRHREGMWANAARKSGVVERPLDAPEWSRAARDAWRVDIEGTMTGAKNAGRVALLEDGMTWKEASWNPEQMQYLDARKLTRQECAASFGVDPVLVFATSTESAFRAQARTAFYVDRFVPLLTRLAEEVDLQLLPDFEPFVEDRRDMYVEFNIDEKLRGSFVDQAAIASAAVGGPFVTVNEMRARLNLPPVEGGDQIYVPLNSTRAGGPQGSPQQPVDTPAQAPTTSETPGGGISTQSRKAAETAPADVKPGVPAPALRRRKETADKYEVLFRKHFDRQLATIRGTLKTRKMPSRIDMVWDGARWDRELADDLAKLSAPVVDENALRAMRQLARKAAYDPDRTRAWIAAATAGMASSINRKTKVDLNTALADEAEDAIEDVFGLAADGRAALLGTSIASAVINFARNEGGTQAGAQSKTWIVTSQNSRHPEMDGETVKVGEDFSNGLPWPGGAGDVAESANCMCLLDLSG
jgi:HK97 family phage portal protein